MLSSLDDKIDLLHRQNKTLEDMAQTLFRKWFIEDADEGWETVKLGDAVNQIWEDFTDKQINRVRAVPFLAAMVKSDFTKNTPDKKPQVLISCRGAASGKVNISPPISLHYE